MTENSIEESSCKADPIALSDIVASVTGAHKTTITRARGVPIQGEAFSESNRERHLSLFQIRAIVFQRFIVEPERNLSSSGMAKGGHE